MHREQLVKDKLIVALDVDGQTQAKSLIDMLSSQVRYFKVGSVLFTLCGPSIVQYINEKGCGVFLDLKFHDIPNTVLCAVESAVSLKVFMMSVHILGGREMLEIAVQGAKQASEKLNIPRPRIIGVTVLTSQTHKKIKQVVLERAKIAKDAGLDGVVCSVHEADIVRKQCGKDFLIITPGIRPQGAQYDDQKRVATVKEAVAAGVDFIVVGRAILGAANPKQVVADIKRQLEGTA